MRQEPTLAVRTLTADWNPRTKLTFRVEGGLHNIASNHAPYFTLTYDEHRKGFPNQCQSGGCGHEKILKYYPQFADLAALHLSDIDGVPMHAEANGWYDLAGALPDNAGEQYHAGNSQRHFPKAVVDPTRSWDTTDYRNPTAEECLQIFADHVRVDVATATALRDLVIECWKQTRAEHPSGDQAILNWTKESWKDARAFFAAWIEQQRPRWKAEADACIKKHNLRIFGDPWKETAA